MLKSILKFSVQVTNQCEKRISSTSVACNNKKPMRQKELKLNYDFTYLSDLSKEQLIRRLVGTQRKLDSLSSEYSLKSICGMEKMRVSYPSMEDLIAMEEYNIRHIAMKVAYIGWNYVCFAHNPGMHHYISGTNTIERVFHEALRRQQLTRHSLIKKAGRTDADVSAAGQVLTCKLRTNLNKGYGVLQRNRMVDENNKITYEFEDTSEGYSIYDTSQDNEEIDYVKLLNAALPIDVRVIAWSPVRKSFSPTSDAIKRTYKYLLPVGNLNIDAMRKGAEKFIGVHNFQNFCLVNEQNAFGIFMKSVYNVDINVKTDDPHPCDMCEISVTGKGFLTRQVRFMVAVLYYIGCGMNEPSIIDELLDVDKYPQRPAYGVAVPHPLILSEVKYDDDEIHWRYDQENLQHVCNSIGVEQMDYHAKHRVLKNMFESVYNLVEDKNEVLKNLSKDFIAGMQDDEPIDEIEDFSSPLAAKRNKFQKKLIEKKIRKGRTDEIDSLIQKHKRNKETEEYRNEKKIAELNEKFKMQ